MTTHPPQPPGRLLPVLLRPGWLAGVVLLACLSLTAVLWRSARADAEQEAQAGFDTRVREMIKSIDLRMQTYQQVLYGVQGLFASSIAVERGEFRTYLAAQDLHQHFPGVQGIGYISLVTPATLGMHLASVRRDGFPDYRILPPGERPLYAPITYMEAISGRKLPPLGLDTWSDPVRRVAMERARDSGQPALSGKIPMRQESGAETPGFMMVLPVYRHLQPLATLAQRREALEGWVCAPFRTADLMAGLGGELGKHVEIEIYDGADAVPAALLYDSAPGSNGAGRSRSSLQKLRVAGHLWTVRLSALPGIDGVRADKVQLIATAGVTFSLMLAALTWLLALSRARARAALGRAQLLTAELEEGQAALLVMAESAQRSQTVLRSILDSTIDGILVDNLRGTVLNSNRRFRELWNVPEQLDWQNDGAVLLEHMAQQLHQPRHRGPHASGQPGGLREERRELLRLKDGRVLEQYTRSLQLGNQDARLWSFRDITERTQTEQRERTRRHVLELLATGAPLQTILEAVVLGVEAGNEEMLCSILLLEEDGEHLLVGAAPSLPSFYNAAVHGKSILSGDGSCCRAILSGTRVITEDISRDPLWAPYRELAAKARLGSCWSDPIVSAGGKVLGTFAIYHREPHRPSMANIAQIEQAAHLAGIAIEQAQAALALRAGEARFRSLYDHAPVALWEQDWSAVRAALAEMDLSGIDDLTRHLQSQPELLQRLAGLVRIVDVNAAALAQVGADPKRKDLSALSLAQNFDAGAMANFAQALTALAQGRHFFAGEGSFERLDGVARLNELTLLVMPGHTLSLDFVIVSTLDITERKRMNEELLVLATTDFLTGLPNRREFMARLDEEQARLQRQLGGSAGCATVILLDVDHFKRINDEMGHAGGDAVLRHLATLMRDSQRKVDMLGRVGGEEFAILLAGTDLEAAAGFAERLRLRIAGTPLLLDGRSVTVTASMGIAALCPSDSSGDAVLIRADQALYRAKRGGRNRVEVTGGEADRPGVQVPAASG
jgi:diguanylate cyclase (GGDEF)-like protein